VSIRVIRGLPFSIFEQTFLMKKPVLLLSLLVITVLASAQVRETFYDFNWKPTTAANATYYSLVTKTDSGWLKQDYFISTRKLQMVALYEDSACKSFNGTCAWFHANGNVSIFGKMLHNKQEGVCVQYHPNGMMSDSGFFKEGKQIGYRLRWHPDGMIMDSIAIVNDSVKIQYNWFDNGVMASAGYLLHDKGYLRWKYYNRFGVLSSVVQFDKGKAVAKAYYNADGTVLEDTSDTEAVFSKGGPAGWRKYLQQAVAWPSRLKLVNTERVTVGVEFTINEEGKVTDVHVLNPIHPEIDRAAIQAIQNSPKWVAARQFNRNVKQKLRQPLTFAQPE
jgi:TonB family protein